MSETRKSLGLGLIALISIVYCLGVPLIAAAGVSVAVVAWTGGIALAVVVLIAVVVLLAARSGRRSGDGQRSLMLRARS